MKFSRRDFMIGYEKLLSEIKLQLSNCGRRDHIEATSLRSLTFGL